MIQLSLYVLLAFKDNLLVVFGNDIRNTVSRFTGVVLFLENKTFARYVRLLFKQRYEYYKSFGWSWPRILHYSRAKENFLRTILTRPRTFIRT